MFAPGVSGVMKEFDNTSILLASFVVSIYLIGYAFGSLLCAPLSEVYGRIPVYRITSVLFIVFTIACATAPSLSSLIGFRFLAGSAGAAPLVLGGGSVADMYPREQRGGKRSIWLMGALIGPVVGRSLCFSGSKHLYLTDQLRTCGRCFSCGGKRLEVGVLAHRHRRMYGTYHRFRATTDLI